MKATLPTPPAPRKWLTLSCLSLAFFFYMTDRALFGLLVVPIQQSTGLTDIQIGLVDTVMFWVYAALVPIAGMLGDRFDRRRIVAASIVLWAVLTALTGLAGGIVGFVVFRSVLMTGVQTFYTPSAVALISDEHRTTRTIALSVHQAAMYVGLMTSGAIVSAALGAFGSWRGVYFLYGALTLAVGLAFASVFCRRAPLAVAAPAAPRRSLRDGMRAFFGNPAAVCAGLGFIVVLFANNAYMTWAPKFVKSKFALDVGASAKGVMLYHNLAALLAILAAGLLTDALVRRHPRCRLVLQALALVAGAPLLVFFGFAPSVGSAWTVLAAWGLARGLFQANAFASVFDVVPAESRASAVGFLNVIASFVCSLSPLAMGALSQRYGTFGFELGFAACGALLLLGAVALLFSCRRLFLRYRVER